MAGAGRSRGCLLSARAGRESRGVVSAPAPRAHARLPLRGSVELKLEELKPFIPPAWMTEKMQKHMETLRNEGDAPADGAHEA